MRREELYLRDIVEAIDHIGEFVAGLDFASSRSLNSFVAP